MKYDIIRVRYGEHQKYLDDGYVPFGVTSENTSYNFLNTSIGKRETQYQNTDYIYLRKRTPLHYKGVDMRSDTP